MRCGLNEACMLAVTLYPARMTRDSHDANCVTYAEVAVLGEEAAARCSKAEIQPSSSL